MTIKGRCRHDLCPEALGEIEKAKAEVAAEIFAEIEKHECHDISGKTTMYMLFTEELAKLKKKYSKGGLE